MNSNSLIVLTMYDIVSYKKSRKTLSILNAMVSLTRIMFTVCSSLKHALMKNLSALPASLSI